MHESHEVREHFPSCGCIQILLVRSFSEREQLSGNFFVEIFDEARETLLVEVWFLFWILERCRKDNSVEYGESQVSLQTCEMNL